MANPWGAPRRNPMSGDWLMQTPLLTSLLCAACVIVTLASFAAQGSHGTGLSQIGDFGAESPDQIWGGHWWGLITTVFLHGSLFHLLFNMIWLYQLGSALERSLNTGVYLLFLVAAAAVGSGCELAFATTTGSGASGVVYALFGLMWAGRGRHPEWGGYANDANLRLFIGWGVFCFVATQFGWLHIANGAHAGGFLFGLSVGWLFLSHRPRRWLWSFPLAGLVALTLASVTWMPWSKDWTAWKGDQERDRQHYAQAISWYGRSLRLPGRKEYDKYDWGSIVLAWDELHDQAVQRHDAPAAAHAAQESAAAERQAGPQDESP